jgi:hypothetical protein
MVTYLRRGISVSGLRACVSVVGWTKDKMRTLNADSEASLVKDSQTAPGDKPKQVKAHRAQCSSRAAARPLKTWFPTRPGQRAGERGWRKSCLRAQASGHKRIRESRMRARALRKPSFPVVRGCARVHTDPGIPEGAASVNRKSIVWQR